MLPGDILGVSIFGHKSSSFVFHAGPIFSQVLLADEINRATPKTRSALLESMEERQVTIEGKTRALDKSFLSLQPRIPPGNPELSRCRKICSKDCPGWSATAAIILIALCYFIGISKNAVTKQDAVQKAYLTQIKTAKLRE